MTTPKFRKKFVWILFYIDIQHIAAQDFAFHGCPQSNSPSTGP